MVGARLQVEELRAGAAQAEAQLRAERQAGGELRGALSGLRQQLAGVQAQLADAAQQLKVRGLGPRV